MSPALAERDSEKLQSFTTARGAMRASKSIWIISVCRALSVPGTTSAQNRDASGQTFILQEPTHSGVRVKESQSSSAAIMELRRLSGLTWEQLARLFGVTPRSLHFWASGQSLTPANEERLHRLLATMRQLDRGSARENRSLLLSVYEGGVIPFDLLVKGQYEQVLTLLGSGQAPVRPKPAALGAEARAARKPYAPEDLAGALQDRVHEDMRTVEVPRVTRSPK